MERRIVRGRLRRKRDLLWAREKGSCSCVASKYEKGAARCPFFVAVGEYLRAAIKWIEGGVVRREWGR